MKKIFLLSVAAITLSFVFMCSSCKKSTTHPTLPTPANNRLLNYTKTSNTFGYQVSENYTFYYDGNNRVSYIIHSTNDTNGSPIGERIVFNYSNDTIVKTITNIRTSKLEETDTFIHNGNNQITTVFIPGGHLNYQYYGKLLSGITQSYSDIFTTIPTNTTVSSTINFTSNNEDLLSSNFNGNLTVNFTGLTPPIVVQWIPVFGIGTTIKHTVGGLSDVLSSYNGLPMTIVGTDAIGISDTGSYPGGLSLQETYTVYPSLANTIGDYFQINSFTTYGYNLYQNDHLLKSITSVTSVKNITYTIDADSRITQTSVVKDSLGHSTTELYNLQYGSY